MQVEEFMEMDNSDILIAAGSLPGKNPVAIMMSAVTMAYPVKGTVRPTTQVRVDGYGMMLDIGYTDFMNIWRDA
jgi:hypothetical protein